MKVKKFIKYLLFSIGIVILLVIASVGIMIGWFEYRDNQLLNSLGPKAMVLGEGDFKFRDLNKNGKLDIYEDSRQPVSARIDDLIKQMTLAEKVGLMLHYPQGIGDNGEVLSGYIGLNPPPSTPNAIINNHANHFNIFFTPKADQLAKWHNEMQFIAERTRLGIPITISSDPRHGHSDMAATFRTEGFSAWCEPIGFGAIQDSSFVGQFGRIARKEYRAVGIHTALHPQIDLATEPRWGRIFGTFGEDATLTSKLAQAYILGFQGDSLTSESVSCMTKHFPGGGPQKDGWDAHFRYGKDQVYPGNNFNHHLLPFEAAFEVNTAQIMPYYGVPLDQTSENVAFAYNKDVIQGLLREKYGFDGVVCSDWGVLEPFGVFGFTIMDSRDYGVESLSITERAAKAINVGIDQFGQQSDPEPLLNTVESGLVSEQRINQSAKRILKLKFQLGLFDNPYVDVNEVRNSVGIPEHMELGLLAQRKSIVLLKNSESSNGATLPLSGNLRIYSENIDIDILNDYSSPVDILDSADIAILKLNAPFEERGGFLESFFHQGRLSYEENEKHRILSIANQKPTILSIHMERPAVIPEINSKVAGLLATFGCEDEAILDVIFGRFVPEGKLPFEIPSSLSAVESQLEDVPYDSDDPLYPFGFGLSYKNPWIAEFNSFDELDRENGLVIGTILFTGSSSIRLWENLGQTFNNPIILNRGFGGSEYSDLVKYYDLIILKYQPSKIVFYSGDNDLYRGKDPDAVIKDFMELHRKIKETLPDTEVIVLNVKPSISRWHLKDAIIELNRKLSRYAASQKELTLIDVFNPMLDEEGSPIADLFLEDGLHMNEKGYQIWIEELRSQVEWLRE